MHNKKRFLSAQAVGKPAERLWKSNPFHVEVGVVFFFFLKSNDLTAKSPRGNG